MPNSLKTVSRTALPPTAMNARMDEMNAQMPYASSNFVMNSTMTRFQQWARQRANLTE